MIACPSCKRRVITRRDVWYASLDGSVPCRACGRTARFDIFSRWVISCVIAILLPSLLLYGNVFYSGHLFLISMFIILGAWRVLSLIALPVLALEPVSGSSIDRMQSLFIVGVLSIAAITIDVLMASRFETEQPMEEARASRAVHVER